MFFFLAMENNREIIQACSIILPPNCAGIIYHRKKVPQKEYELLQTICICLQEGEERKIQKPWTGRSSELWRSDQVRLPENERKLYAHRSMIFSLPPGSQHPISPVCNQPSSLRISRLRHQKQRHSWVSFCDGNRVGKRYGFCRILLDHKRYCNIDSKVCMHFKIFPGSKCNIMLL